MHKVRLRLVNMTGNAVGVFEVSPKIIAACSIVRYDGINYTFSRFASDEGLIFQQAGPPFELQGIDRLG